MLFQQALGCYETTGLLGGKQGIVLMLAEVSLVEGDRGRAAHGFRQVLGLLDAHPEQVQTQLTDTLGKRRAHFEHAACYSLAGLAFEENRLQEAQHLLGMALIEGQFALSHVLTPGLLLQVRVLTAIGEGEQAATLLLDLETAVREPDLAREIRLCRAWLARACGDLVALQAWAAALPQGESQPLSCARREEEVLLLSRLRIAEERPEEAVLLLGPLLEEARRNSREGSVLQIQVVLALAEAARGKRVQAKQRLLEAVGKASESRMVRPFLEEGEMMEQLLRELRPDLRDARQAAHVDALLHAFAHVPLSQEEPAPASRVTPVLTPQEQRVLALLAQGASTQESATILVIRLTTVKSHVSHLLRKLGATTRIQALARAREQGLL
jgi:LuxR family maltose regulon positive regulatory protein